MSLDEVRSRAEKFLEEVSREYHAAHAGLKQGANLQPIYARHADTYGDEVLSAVRSEYDTAKTGSDAHRSARLLLDWLIGSRIGRYPISKGMVPVSCHVHCRRLEAVSIAPDQSRFNPTRRPRFRRPAGRLRIAPAWPA